MWKCRCVVVGKRKWAARRFRPNNVIRNIDMVKPQFFRRLRKITDGFVICTNLRLGEMKSNFPRNILLLFAIPKKTLSVKRYSYIYIL